MTYEMPTQSAEYISQRYAEMRMLDAMHHVAAERQARAAKDMADYKRERRVKAIRRYLKERAAR